MKYILRENRTGRGRAGHAEAETRQKQSGEKKELQNAKPGVNYPEKQAMQLRRRWETGKQKLLGLKPQSMGPSWKDLSEAVQGLAEDLEWAKWCPSKAIYGIKSYASAYGI